MLLCFSLQIYVGRHGEDKEIKDIDLYFKKWSASRIGPQAGTFGADDVFPKLAIFQFLRFFSHLNSIMFILNFQNIGEVFEQGS
jgi:hypothetical protein